MTASRATSITRTAGAAGRRRRGAIECRGAAGADPCAAAAKDYQSVVAPFDGVVTQRNIDVGSLVQADATTGTFMFTVMQTNVIRTQVYVPQDQAFGVAPGVEAVVRVPEMPDRSFPGK